MKLIITLSLFIFWTSCQNSPVRKAVEDQPFSLQKINSSGVEVVQFSKSEKNEWPSLTRAVGSPLAVNSQTIVFGVVGDTGCRLKETKKKNSYQNCLDLKQWPYPVVAQSLEKENLDLVIHTGDYHYREQCTKFENCPENVGYGWGAWWDDFYKPSLGLFKKAPHLFVRGNHEDCERAYQGWAPLATSKSDFNSKCRAQEPTEIIEIGDLVLVNLDTAEFEDKKKLNEQQKNEWAQILKNLTSQIKMLGKKREVWLMTHKPVLGYYPDEETAEPQMAKENFYNLAQESGLLDVVDFVLSGHIHNQQLVIQDPRFVQIIIGHGGTVLEPFGRTLKTDKIISTTEKNSDFGYALFSRERLKSWKFEFKDSFGNLVLKCQVKDKKVDCP